MPMVPSNGTKALPISNPELAIVSADASNPPRISRRATFNRSTSLALHENPERLKAERLRATLKL
jgi:hypothetical protein